MNLVETSYSVILYVKKSIYRDILWFKLPPFFFYMKKYRNLWGNATKFRYFVIVTALRNTFIRGPHYNTYKNSKNIDNELGFPPLLSTQTL